jgi:hypothetical protein
MKKIDGYALTLAALMALPYVAAPLVKEDFTADAPEAPPTASIVLTSAAVYDTIKLAKVQ